MPSRYTDEPGVAIREGRIPESFRHLLPLARVWCIGDDVERDEFMSTTTHLEKIRLVDAVSPHFEALAKWSAIENTKVPVPGVAILFDMLALAAAEAQLEVQDDAKEQADAGGRPLRGRC